MEVFNREDVDPLARTAFCIVLMDAKREHLRDQSGAQTGGAEENVSVTIAYMVRGFLQSNTAVRQMLPDNHIHGTCLIVKRKGHA